MKSKTLSDLEATTNKNCVRCKPKASCLLHEGYGMAIEDVRAMLLERVKELEGLLIFAREEGKNFLYEKKDIDYFKGQVNELRRIAGKGEK